MNSDSLVICLEFSQSPLLGMKRECPNRKFRLAVTARNSNSINKVMPYLFSFAAKGLQSYVLEGDQLKTMTGATELIDRLCRAEFLEKLLDAAKIEQKEVLQGAAGSARIWIEQKEDAQRLSRVWPVFCNRWAPGLNVVQSLQEIGSEGMTAAIKAAEDEMRISRNFIPPALPLATPVMERCRRTGRAAVELDDEKIPRDAALARKAMMRDEIKGTVTPLLKCFGFKSMLQVPSSFEAISGSERAYLAVIHADGNGLGQMFMKLAEITSDLPDQKTAQECFGYISKEVIEEGTKAAVEKASMALDLDPVDRIRPLQPIVLAGDDLTLVCRADLAWDFTTAFIRAFEQEIGNRLNAAKCNSDFPKEMRDILPSGLTAGAGIAYVSGHYPFSLGYALAEALAHRAKSKAKRRKPGTPPSSIMFHRVSGAYAPTDYESLAATHLQGDGVVLGAGPYYLDPTQSPNTDSLEILRDAINVLPTGSVREVLNLLATESSSVAPAMARMLSVAAAPEIFKDSVMKIGLDEKLCGEFHDEPSTPLPDAWTLKLMKPDKQKAAATA